MSRFNDTVITQDVKEDTGNSSTTNLDPSTTFTGVGKSTLGVNGLQWSLKTTENCTVCIEESDSQDSNWDISYCFDYIASKGGRGETVQATKAYWRVTVTNLGVIATSYFRLSSVLCPVALPLPSDLSADGRLKSESTLVGRENTNRYVWINPTNELAISPVYRMVGTAFDNDGNAGAVDTNFWTAVVTNAGTIVQDGGIVTLNTNGTAGGTTSLTSVRRARFVAGSAMLFQGGFASSAAAAGNTRRIGAYDDDNGVFAQFVNTTFSIGTRKYDGTTAGVDTLIDSGDFNGNLGASFTPVADTYYKLTIEYSPLAVHWYINGTLLHKISGGNYSDTMTLPIKMECNNDTVDTANTFKTFGAYIARQGEITTNPTSYYHADATLPGGVQLKYGSGIVRGIILNNATSGAVIYLTDSTTTTTPVLWKTTTGKIFDQPVALDFHGMPFSNGLRFYVDTGDTASATIIYE